MQEERLGQMLGTEEVAEYLGVGPVTVYRWCREGSLPCVKIGRRWRVRREALEEFIIRKSERSETLTGRLRAFIEVPDNLLAISQNRELMRRLDAAFFRVGLARGGTLIKYQLEDERMPSLEDVRAEMAEMGLEVDRLEDEGRLRLVSEGGGSEGRVNEVRRLVTESSEGDRSLWANFNWDLSMSVDEALDQQRLLTKLVEDSSLVLKTAILEEDLDEWPGETQRRAQVTHSGTVWLSREGLAMSRVTPPPAL